MPFKVVSVATRSGLMILSVASAALLHIPSKAAVGPLSASHSRSRSDQQTAIIINATVTKNAVLRSIANDQRLYRQLDAAVAEKQKAIRRLNISEGERRRLGHEIAELRSQQAALISELEKKDIEFAAALRAFREGLNGLLDSKDPRIIEAVQRYAEGDPAALDQVQGLTRIVRTAREAGTRARNGDEARGVALLFNDARTKGLKTVQQVLDAWLEAANVEPDIAGSWVEIARLHVQMGNLDDAAKAAEHAEKLAIEPEWRAAALDELADIARRQGRFNDAETIQARAVQVADQIVELNPDDVQARRGLSVALNKAGFIAQLVGKEEEAERDLLRALSIRRKIQRELPYFQGPYRDVGVTLSLLVGLKFQQGKYEEAKTYSDEYLKIFDRLEAMNPGDTFAALDKSIAMRRASDIAIVEGRIDDAIDLKRKAADINLGIWRTDPRNESHRREVAVTFDALISNQLAAERYADALQSAEGYVDFAKKLMADDPTNYRSKIKLAVALGYRGMALRLLGRKGADTALSDAISILEGLGRETVTWPADQVLLQRLRDERARIKP